MAVDKVTNSGIWPDFFIVGAAKAGTTSLYEYLKQHPGVYMSPVKEPHFFSQIKVRLRPEKQFARPINEVSRYTALFEGEGGVVVGEASTSYLWDEQAPYEIRQRVPGARIIILLRDPVERAYSHYLMAVRGGRETQPFYEALLQDAAREEKGWGISHLYVELGCYASQISRYLEVFGEEQVRIYLLDNFECDPKKVLRNISIFLGVDPEGVDFIDTESAHNAYTEPRNVLARRVMESSWIHHAARVAIPRRLGRYVRENVLLSKKDKKPALDPRATEYLGHIYGSEIKELEVVLGQRLPELRKGW